MAVQFSSLKLSQPNSKVSQKLRKWVVKVFPMGPKLEFGILTILQFEFSNYVEVKNLKKKWIQKDLGPNINSKWKKYFHFEFILGPR